MTTHHQAIRKAGLFTAAGVFTLPAAAFTLAAPAHDKYKANYRGITPQRPRITAEETGQ
jgi:hypothetical protein